MNDLISIIIPTHNRADFIEPAIKSVLAQSYKNWELIIIDDASSDNTGSIVQSFIVTDTRIKYFKNILNLGISKSRNYGLTEAKGEYVAMLDSDDIWLDPNKLEKQLAIFKSNANIGIVGTWVQAISEDDMLLQKIEFPESNEDIKKVILHKNTIAQSSVLFKKRVAQNVGGYDESLATMEDHDLWLKMGTLCEIKTIPEYCTGYRIHPNGITKSKKKQVAMNKLSVIWRHRNEYPGMSIGLLKGSILFLLSVVDI